MPVLCPFCGKPSEVGLLLEVEPGQPTPIFQVCEHNVVEIHTDLVWDYLALELHKGLNELRGVTQFKDELDTILRKHLKIVDRVAFAESGTARQAAREEVAQFLRSRGYVL